MNDLSAVKLLSELTPQVFALFVAGSGILVRSLSTEKSQWVVQLAEFLAQGGGPRPKLALAAAAQAASALSITAFFSATTALLIDSFFGFALRPHFAAFYYGSFILVLFLAGWFVQLFVAVRPHQWALTTTPWLPFKIYDRFRAKPVAQMDFWALVMLIVLLVSGGLKIWNDDGPAKPPIAAREVARPEVGVRPSIGGDVRSLPSAKSVATVPP